MAHHILVLWGYNFDEAVAAIFVSKLRQAGLLVKLVGIAPPPLKGSRGLALIPDLTLDQAWRLVASVRCLIIPCAGQYLHQLKNDPRLAAFLEQVQQNQPIFVIERLKEAELNRLSLLSAATVVFYPAGPALFETVDVLAGMVQQVSG